MSRARRERPASPLVTLEPCLEGAFVPAFFEVLADQLGKAPAGPQSCPTGLPKETNRPLTPYLGC